MKEIGGYLELEELNGKEYYPELLKLNLGRTALLYCLEKLSVKKLWLPYYLCDSVISVCQKYGCQIFWYTVDKAFLPVLSSESLENGEYLFLVNYYGQISNKQIEEYKLFYGNLIVDNTHAFYQKPVENVPTLYSCRKFFGLPDGAYLYLPGMDSCIDLGELPLDISCSRMSHILGRYEYSASDYYQTMLDNAHSYYQEPIKRMSRLTSNLLKAIDYKHARKRREENYHILESCLSTVNRLQLNEQVVPFVYPLLCADGLSLKKSLAKEKIFVPTYWNNVIDDHPKDTAEYNYAANILPLPCDQRYTSEDMKYLAETIKRLMKGQEYS